MIAHFSTHLYQNQEVRAEVARGKEVLEGKLFIHISSRRGDVVDVTLVVTKEQLASLVSDLEHGLQDLEVTGEGA